MSIITTLFIPLLPNPFIDFNVFLVKFTTFLVKVKQQEMFMKFLDSKKVLIFTKLRLNQNIRSLW